LFKKLHDNYIMDKRQKLLCVVAKLQQLLEFLEPYLPLANVHNTNFIVSRHWETMISETIGRELLQLDDYHLSLLPAGELCYCDSAHVLANSSDCNKDVCASMNSVEENSAFSSKLGITTSCDLSSECNSRIVSNEAEITTVDAGDMKQNPSDEMTDGCNICHSAESNIKPDGLPEWDYSLIPNWQHHSLKQFIMAAVSCTLPQLGLLTSIDELSCVLGLQQHDTQTHIVVSHAMKIKKSYEIDVMANLCAWMAKGFSISNVSRQ